jgi:hypothetical protein
MANAQCLEALADHGDFADRRSDEREHVGNGKVRGELLEVDFPFWSPIIQQQTDPSAHHWSELIGEPRRELGCKRISQQTVLTSRQGNQLLFGKASPGGAVGAQHLDDPCIGWQELVILTEKLADRSVLVDQESDARFGEPRMLLSRFAEEAMRVLREFGSLYRQVW